MNIIKQRRMELNMTLEDVGNIVGVGKSTVRKWENGIIENLRRDNIVALSKALKISPLEILGMDESKLGSSIEYIYNQLDPPRQKYVYDVAEHQLEEQNNVIEFPDHAKELIRGRRMAGGSALHVDDTDARKEVVSSALIPKGADELVEVVGKSMEPLIKDGEEVYIRYQPTVENGEIAVVRIENEGVTCKRVYVEENSIRLKAENPDYEDMYYDAGQVTILGKVLL